MSRRFCQTLKRLTSLNHLCQAARSVVHSADVTSQMLYDWSRVDLPGICKQTIYTMDKYSERDYDMIVTRESAVSSTLCTTAHSRRLIQGCSGAGTRGDGVPHTFFDRGTRPPLPHFFGLKFVQKLVHCCNWLLTETQCKIISVHQN